MWMQPTCERASESSAHPHSDAESDRTSDSESIKDYANDETDYEESSNNESITDLDEQLRERDENNRSLSKIRDERIDNLETKMGDNNMIRRQQTEIHPWLDYEFDELIENMERERRTILGQDAYLLSGKKKKKLIQDHGKHGLTQIMNLYQTQSCMKIET